MDNHTHNVTQIRDVTYTSIGMTGTTEGNILSRKLALRTCRAAGVYNNDDARAVAFAVAYKKESGAAIGTLNCYDLALFEEAFDPLDATQFPFFVGFAVDYLCRVSPLLWNQSTKDGVAYRTHIPKTAELLNETAYARQFLDSLAALGFLDFLAGTLDNADPTDVRLDELQSDVSLTVDVPGSDKQTFTVKCDAFQQAIACINLRYESINHPLLTIQELIRLQ